MESIKCESVSLEQPEPRSPLPTPKYNPPSRPCTLESVVVVDSLAAYVTAAVKDRDDVTLSIASKMRHNHGL
jgi:hypothetical protein